MNNLESLFLSDPSEAIVECQNLICKSSHFDSYENFFSYHKDHSHVSTCQTVWQDSRMSIHCFDCSLDSSSCMCLKCFLNGDHKGHNYVICPDTNGNCDCGDISLWRRSGFCKDHQGLADENQNPEDYLDKELRTTLTDVIFKSAFSALIQLTSDQDHSSSDIFQFISSFLQFGDGFRRLIAITLIDKVDFYELLKNANKYTLKFNQNLLQLCGNLINDQLFKKAYAKISYMLAFDNIKNQDYPAFKVWGDFSYHAFSPPPMQYNILHNNWDWVDFYIKIMKECKEILNFVGDEDYRVEIPGIINSALSNVMFATATQPNEQTQLLFDRLFSEVLNSGTKESPNQNNTIIAVSFKEKTERFYYRAARTFNLSVLILISCFRSKKNLKLDVLFDQLKSNTYISMLYKLNSNDNDKYVSKFIQNEIESKSEVIIPDFYFKSFHDGASFFYTAPLYDALVSLLGLETLTKIKAARLFQLNQDLRVKIGLITLKKILSFATYDQSLTPKNFGLMNMIKVDSDLPDMVTLGAPRYFPVFQLLIGLTCNSADEEFSLKDFYAYEMARELGLFDDFLEDENYRDEDINETTGKMIFSFLYLSLVFVVERILFNFNTESFIREQLICALKNGVSDLNKLSQSYDKRVLYDYENPVDFNNVLFSIASIKEAAQSSSDEDNDKVISFALKDGVKFNSISAIIPITKQKSLLNNEISLHPDKLISIQDFEPEETYFFNAPMFAASSLTSKSYKINNDQISTEIAEHEGLNIRLNELLLTPTVLAVCYHTLKDKDHLDLNDHLSLNVLLLISKFLKGKSDTENDKGSDMCSEIIEYDTLEELITKFRTVVFKYQTADDNHATIQKTINNHRQFVTFLSLKISHKKAQPKSFIDVIQEKGQIGKDVLSMMSINLNEDDTNGSKSEVNEKMIKKQRANKLKEEIMNRYKNMISTYKEHDDGINSSTNSMEILDSVDSLNSPTCSGLINGVTEVCAVCSTIKKKEALSFPIFIYQTKFPFIVDKPPLLVGNENEISVACDDDVDYESDDDEDSANQDESVSQHESENQLSAREESESQLETSQESEIQLEPHHVESETQLESSEHQLNESRPDANHVESETQLESSEHQLNTNQESESHPDANNVESAQQLSSNQESESQVEIEIEQHAESEPHIVLSVDEPESSERQAASDSQIDNSNNASSRVGSENLLESAEEADLQEIDGQLDILNQMINEFLEARESGTVADDEFNHTMVAFQEAYRDLRLRRSILERIRFMRDLRDEKQRQRALNKQRRLEERKSNPDKPRRYTAGANFVVQFAICQHSLHPKCVENESYHCPIDRTVKNGFLPNLDSIQGSDSNSLPGEVKESIDVFINGFKKFVVSSSRRKIDLFVELVKSLSGLVTTFEVRLRSLPACLDSSTTKLLARNLFLATWHAYRIQGKPAMADLKPYNRTTIENGQNVESRLTLFQMFIKKLVESDEVVGDKVKSAAALEKIVDSFVKENLNKEERSERTEKELYLFLKRVCLANYFLLENEVNVKDKDDYYNYSEFVEWDDVLSIQNLSKQFNVGFNFLNEGFEFKPFIFSKLPKEFLHFALKPYEFPVEMTQNFCVYNLIDYNYLIDNYDDLSDKYDDVNQNQESTTIDEKKIQLWLSVNYSPKHYPTALLLIGKLASKVLIIHNTYTTTLKPFYFDQYGSPDFGFARGERLFLNEQVYERFVDEILSGGFSNYI